MTILAFLPPAALGFSFSVLLLSCVSAGRLAQGPHR